MWLDVQDQELLAGVSRDILAAKWEMPEWARVREQ